jgi:hypothetical protein
MGEAGREASGLHQRAQREDLHTIRNLRLSRLCLKCVSFMSLHRLVLLTAAALLVAGCSTFDRRELGYLQQRGVSPELVAKLDRGHPISPSDAIELRSRGIPDSYVLRHLYADGLNQIVTRSDAVRMRRAGVSAIVIDAFLRESDRFARGYAQREEVHYYGTSFEDPWAPGYYDGWGVGVGFGL